MKAIDDVTKNVNDIVTGFEQKMLEATKIEDYETHGKPFIQYQGNDTIIGPYSITQRYGKITDIQIKTGNETISIENKDDIYYRIGDSGQEIKPGLTTEEKNKTEDIKSISVKQEDEFYIIVKDQKIDNIEEIKLIKNYTNYQARIVMAFGAWQTNPVNAMYYGQRFTERENCTLPKIPEIEITLEKTDKDTGDQLRNTRFVIKQVSGNNHNKYLVAGNPVTYVSNIEKATQFAPYETIKHIQISQSTNFEIYEVQSENDEYEQANIKNPIYMKRITLQPSTTNNIIKMINERKYIKIGGYVWQDIEPNGGNPEDRNKLYKNDRNDTKDQLLRGIYVQLKDRNGKVIQTTTTKADGTYLFEQVEIDELSNYYIVFQYNGMSYQSVLHNLEKENGSKATESQDENDEKSRDSFNKGYETITKGKSNGHNLNYKTSEGKSELLYREDGKEEKYEYGYDTDKEDRGPVSGVDDQYIIEANTKQAYGGYLDKVISITDIRKGNIKEIKNVNLGIEKREQPDLKVSKSLNSVTVGIKGQTQTYQYATNSEQTPEQKKYQEGNTYVRALYESDIYYEGEKDRLEIKVTYAIKIRNTSSNLKAKVNVMEDYYDSKYLSEENTIKVGKSIDEEGNITKELKVKNKEEKNPAYCKIEITTDLDIGAGEDKTIYVQLMVDREKIVEIFQDGKQPILKNIAEISSYSTYDTNGKVYGGIDKNSQPGNVEIDDFETYEDDTGKAQDLKLVLQEPRKITGEVFEDKVTGEVGVGKPRCGNGYYDEEDSQIEDVIVQLVDEDNNAVQIWDYNAEKNQYEWKDAVTTTQNDGTYEIKGFLPGQYKIIYTWGNEKYPVQNYKSITVDSEAYEKKLANPQWYKEGYKSTELKKTEWNDKTNTEKRVSDALDNYDTREKIDNQTKIVTNGNQKSLEKSGEAEKSQIKVQQENGIMESENLITTMDSATPKFEVNIEYFEYNGDTNKKLVINSWEEYELDKDGRVKIEKEYVEKTPIHKNILKSIDFGIVERARQKVGLYKYVKNAKITLANGRVLFDVHVAINEKGERELQSGLIRNVIYLPRTDKDNGQIKFEIDNEIVQGSRLQITYGFYTKNESELDYNDEKYYHYGMEPRTDDNIVKLKVDKIIDYLLENDLVVNPEEIGNQWKILTETKEKEQLRESGLLDNDMKTFLNDMNRVLVTQDGAFTNQPLLKPGEVSDTGSDTEMLLTGSKLLANNGEYLFENYAEIIKVEKTGGAPVYSSILGNYNPTKNETKEIDSDQAETVEILPPTGENRNYVVPIVIGITVLIILSIGIIIIMKRQKNKIQ